MKNELEEIFLVGLGAASVTKQKIEKVVNKFVKKGAIDKTQAKALAKKMIDDAKKIKDKLKKEGQKQIKRAKKAVASRVKRTGKKVSNGINNTARKAARRAIRKK